MAEGNYLSVGRQVQHIELTVGNVFVIGLSSLLFYGAAQWGSLWLVRHDVPILSPLAVGALNYLSGGAASPSAVNAGGSLNG
jgi:hypothetical protein